MYRTPEPIRNIVRKPKGNLFLLGSEESFGLQKSEPQTGDPEQFLNEDKCFRDFRLFSVLTTVDVR